MEDIIMKLLTMAWYKIKCFSRKLPVTMLGEKKEKNETQRCKQTDVHSSLSNFTPSPTLDLPYIFSDFRKKRNSKPQPFCTMKFKFQKVGSFRSIEQVQILDSKLPCILGYCNLSSVSRDCLIGSGEMRKGRKCEKEIK